MKIKQAGEVEERIKSYGINLRMGEGYLLYRKTPQATCVKKLIAQGYKEVRWPQDLWNAYYNESRAVGCHNYIGAGMGANVLMKGNEVIIVGRSTFMWTMAVIEL